MKKVIKKLYFLLLLLFTIAFVSCIGTYANASNNNVTPVYWYITDNGTTLHLSGTKPTNPNYVEGNNDFQSQKRDDDYLKKTYQKLTGKSDSKYSLTTRFKDDKLELYFTDSNYKEIGESQKPSDFFNSPVYNATKIIIDNEIAPSSLDFRYMYNVYEISNLQYLNTINLKELSFDYCSNIQSLNLSSFNTANFTSMSSMFMGCRSLQSLDLSSFNTSSVMSMWFMFTNCESLQSLDLSSFNTSSVTSMDSMFSGCYSLQSLDLSSFNTSSVTSMDSMFHECSSLQSLDLSSFNTSSVTSMSHMFYKCSSLQSLDLSPFNTSSVTSMEGMFSDCKSLQSLDLSSFNTSSVTSMENMFSSCRSLQSLDLSSFNTSSVTSMSNMFIRCESLQSLDLSSFNTSSVTSMAWMFHRCESLQSLDLSSFNTSSVTSMWGMFNDCRSLQSLDLSSFNTSSVTSIDSMFSSCGGLKTIYASTDLYKSNNSVTSESMFHGCSNLIGGNGTKFHDDLRDCSMAVIDSPNKKGYLTYKEPTKQTKTLTSAYKSNTSLIAGLPSQESELRNDKHFYLDNKMQKNNWVYYVQYYYHVDENGNIEKSKWVEKRYVGADGRMYRGRQTPDGKWVGDDGLAVDAGLDLSKSLTIEAAKPDSWYKTQNGLWYYFENDRTTTKKGWFNDVKDGQTYYLDEKTGIMKVGWVTINGNQYYFNESHENTPNWYEVGDGFYESLGNKTKSYGSMFKNETTPDGKKVDGNGKLIKNTDE